MAILNWRDHPRLRFVDFPPPFLTKGSVYIASDRGDSAWMSDGTAYYPLYGSGLEAPNLGVMAWASKPDPTSVPVGTRFTASDLNWTDWQTNGAYWAPVNGEAVLVRKRLHDMPITAYNVLAEVPNAFNNFIIPDDLLMSPGAPSFETRAQGRRNGTLGATQLVDLRIGVESSTSALGTTNMTSASASNAVLRVYGYTSQISTTGNYQVSGVNDFQDGGSIGGGTLALAALSGQPIKLYAQNGASDGSETWAFHNCELTIHLA